MDEARPLDKTDLSVGGPIMRLVLTGFMGSGKSTLGRLLAQQLGWRFLDLDDEIERRDGRTVAEIFAESGETIFRALEAKELERVLETPRIVLALGGGAIETPANRMRLLDSAQTVVVLLTAPFDVLYTRCVRQAQDPNAAVRPLLSDASSAAQRLQRRDELYRAVASFVIDTQGQQPEESTQRILRALRSTL